MARFLSELPEGVSGSLADEVVPWLADHGDVILRPWQEEVLRRAWAVDSDGRLVWRTVVVSTPRQSGKSWLARAWVVARCQFPQLFGGEPQLVGHMANNLRAALRIQEQAWGWAAGRGLQVRRVQGGERIIWPDGGQWALSSLSAVYGASLSGVVLDEIWDIRPEVYREAVVPTQAARRLPQLLAVSTANSHATALPGQLMRDGRLGLRRTMLADWGAHPDDDVDDPKVWEAASPHWDEDRAEAMSLAAGSPSFASQWLNVWAGDLEAWRWLPRLVTDGCRTTVGWPSEGVGVVGVESRWNQSEDDAPGRWAVAVAYPVGTGLRARVDRVDTLDEVIALAGDRRVFAHSTVVEQLAAFGRGWRTEAVNSVGGQASGEVLAQMVRNRRVQVQGVDDATWAAVRITPTAAGDTVDARRSEGDVAGVKALGYAVAAAARATHSGPVLVA